MARAPLRRCTAPGCRKLVRTSRCEEHRDKQHTPATGKDQWCGNRRWRRLRRAFLLEHPTCDHCEQMGRTRAAEDVHHKRSRRTAPELAYDWDNLQALCKACHSRETARERQQA